MNILCNNDQCLKPFSTFVLYQYPFNLCPDCKAAQDKAAAEARAQTHDAEPVHEPIDKQA
jgi:hypothetical protein